MAATGMPKAPACWSEMRRWCSYGSSSNTRGSELLCRGRGRFEGGVAWRRQAVGQMGQIKPLFCKVLYEGLLEKHYKKDLLSVPSVPAAAPHWAPSGVGEFVTDDRRTAPFRDGRVTLAAFLNDRRNELQEDYLSERQQSASWTWSASRPHGICHAVPEPDARREGGI